MTLRHGCAAGVGLALAAAGASQAGTVEAGWTLDLGPDRDTPGMTLANDSDAGVDLTALSLTIGDTSKGYDFVFIDSNPPGGTAALSPTAKPTLAVDDDVTADAIELDFTGFSAGESAEWTTDIDANGGVETNEDYAAVLFDNGAPSNAVVEATFRSALFANNPDRTVSLTLPDFQDETPVAFEFAAAETYQAVPVPAALPLLGAGLVALGFLSRRRGG